MKIFYSFLTALTSWLIIIALWDYFDAQENNQLIKKLISKIIPNRYDLDSYDWLNLSLILLPTFLIMYLKKISQAYSNFQIYFYSLIVWILSLSIWDKIYGVEGGLIFWNKLVEIFLGNSNDEKIKNVMFIFLPSLIIWMFFTRKIDNFFLKTNEKEIKSSKNKISKAGVLGAVIGTAAYIKASHANKTPAVTSRDPSKVKVLSVVPRGNEWVVHYEWDYNGDGSNLRKEKHTIDNSLVSGFNVGPTALDVDWN